MHATLAGGGVTAGWVRVAERDSAGAAKEAAGRRARGVRGGEEGDRGEGGRGGAVEDGPGGADGVAGQRGEAAQVGGESGPGEWAELGKEESGGVFPLFLFLIFVLDFFWNDLVRIWCRYVKGIWRRKY